MNGRGWRLALAAMAALACVAAPAHAHHSKLSLESIGPAGGNGPQAADVVGAADIGKRAFLTTPEALASPDTDASFDLYSRTGGTTAVLSAGTPGGNGAYPANWGRARASGTRVFFQTDERLTTGDTDNSLDVYMREGNSTTLVSTGPGAGAFGAYDSYFAAASQDGSRVFFTTRGSLVGSDSDQSLDLYQRTGGSTTLVSTGPAGGNGPWGADLTGISDDGTKVFFHSAEGLVASDTDGVQDVYQRSGGTTTLLSTGPNGGNGAHRAVYSGNSQDGTKVFFRTAESLLAADTDAGLDIYERADATTTTIHSMSPNGGNDGTAASFVGASQDGSKVFVDSLERLIASPVDRDSQNDVYMSSGGTLTMISPGGNDTIATNAYFAGATADGGHVYIRSEESLAFGDTDQYQDIFDYTGGTIARLSLGPTGGNGSMHAFFAGVSQDGASVFFETREALVAEDTDDAIDVYERHSGTTHLISLGPAGGNGTFDVRFRGVSADGDRVFLQTSESLVAADSDSAPDVYSANVPGTITVRLDSLPDDPQDFAFQAYGLDDGFAFGPPDFGPTNFSLDDDSDPTLSNERVFTGVTPGIGYSVSQTAAQGWDLTSATCDDGSPVTAIDVSAGEDITCTFTNTRQAVLTGYPRPKGATPTRFSLVPAYQECQAPNRVHGPELAFGSCNPPQREQGELTVGTPDANGASANFSGVVKLDAILGVPSTPADEADLRLTVSLADVRLASNLLDYSGELESEMALRLTDRDAGVPMTVQDVPFAFAVPCAATAQMGIGSTCALSTTMDALVPGAVKELQRTIWQLDQIAVNDGGADGVAATEPNSTFARPGIFIP